MKGWACIARMGGIGDNLIAASVLRPLKRMGYMCEVITSEMAHEVYINNPFIDKLSVKADGDIPGGDAWQQWFVSRAKEYDVFAHLSHSVEARHSLHISATAFWHNQDYRRKLCAGSFIETAHDIVGVPYEFGPLYFPKEEEKDRAQHLKNIQIGGPYIAWILSGSRIDKIYPYAGAAICRIIKELNIPVVMFGIGEHQYEMAKSIQTDVKMSNSSLDGLHLALNSQDLGGKNLRGHEGDQSWPVRRSLAQILAADLVITPDTGSAWAAAFEPMPKICMVSHASAENITKHWVNTTTLHADSNRVPCWPCHRLHNDISTCNADKENGRAAACMSDITVETVMKAIIAKWPKGNVVKLVA